MKLIAGLGNIGKEYKNTRHNVGFEVVDFMASYGKFSIDTKMEAEILKEGSIIFVKPTTFMNESGRAVRKIMDFYKLNLSDLVLCHDDLDLKIGEYKIQKGIGPKIHNGVSSVEDYVGSKDFLRVRIGVDGRGGERTVSGADYVLGRFLEDEQESVNEVMEEASEELLVALGL